MNLSDCLIELEDLKDKVLTKTLDSSDLVIFEVFVSVHLAGV